MEDLCWVFSPLYTNIFSFQLIDSLPLLFVTVLQSNLTREIKASIQERTAPQRPPFFVFRSSPASTRSSLSFSSFASSSWFLHFPHSLLPLVTQMAVGLSKTNTYLKKSLHTMITMRLKTRATLLLGGWLPDVGANRDHIAVALISNIVFFFS